MISNLFRQPAGLNSNLKNKNACLVVGVLNVTPDSFSDGGLFNNTSQAIEHSKKMISQGADLIDIGGESTRPGAERISVTEELERVIPVISELTKLGISTSIDTMNSQTAVEAIKAGVQMVNDVSGGLNDEKMHHIISKYEVPYVLMHWRGQSKVMDDLATYKDVVTEVIQELNQQINKAIAAGINRNRIVIDPGLGFAKSPEHNWEILKNINRFHELELPIYIGASRKRFLADFSYPKDSQDTKDRDMATTAISSYVAERGVFAVRVHDVAGSAIAVKVSQKLKD